jgi:hypothetical protein
MQKDDLTQMDVVRALRHLPLPMPTDPAQTVQLFGLYDPRDGLEKLIGRLKLDGATPRHIYNAVLGRAPDDITTATPADIYNPARHLEAVLKAPAFQKNAMRNFLGTFSSKRREIFFHIPKCAGTDLILNLAPGRLSFPRALDFDGWTSKEDFFSALGGLVQAAPYFDDVFIYGHMQVGEYTSLAGVRSDDKMFTVIRNPVDLLLSQANYAVSRLRQDPEGKDPDVQEILGFLGLSGVSDRLEPKYVKRLTAQCLLDVRISQPDRICFYLGKDLIPSFEQAIQHIVTYDIEVTDTSRYGRWLKDRWNIESSTRHNESEKVLTAHEMRRLFPKLVRERTNEDGKLFSVIRWALAKKGTSSIRGSEIADIAGSDLLTELPDRVRSEDNIRCSVLAVQGEANISFFQASIPAELLDASATRVGEYALTANGNGNEVTGDGWAIPEADFTWTNAKQASIGLKKPTIPGHYFLRIVCTPFLAEQLLPVQCVEITLNGQKIGTVRLSARAVIDCDLPWEVLETSGPSLQLYFDIPDAKAPLELGSGDDDRCLGLAVESVEFTRLSPISEPDVGKPIEQDDIALDALMLRFESLGENCEFGLAQRRCGAEPLGLFRFSSAPLPKLVNAFRSKFKGMGKANSIVVQESSNGSEYMVLDKRFGFLFHAWVLVGERSPEEVKLREMRRIPFLVRKLTEELALGEKIFVYHGMQAMTLEQARDLSAALREFGPATLLWTELADAQHAPGTVEQIEPGLLKGYMDRFAPGENAHDLSLDCWITVCRNAYRIWKSA